MIKKLLIIIAVIAVILIVLSVLPNDGLEFYCRTESGEAEFAIIDPLGRYLGYEPSKNIKVTDERHMSGKIPDAYYSCFSTGAVDGGNIPIPPPKDLWIQKPISGFYVIKVFGISNSDHYRIYLENTTLEGVVKRGQVIDYYLMIIPTPFAIIQSSVKTEPANFIIPIIIAFIIIIILGIFTYTYKKFNRTSIGDHLRNFFRFR